MKRRPKSDEQILADIRKMLGEADDGELSVIRDELESRMNKNKGTAIRAYRRYEVYDRVLRTIEAEIYERSISK